MGHWELGGEEFSNQARAFYQKSIEINPELFSTLGHLSMLYTEFGETDLVSIFCGLRPVTYLRPVWAFAFELARRGDAAVPTAAPPAKSAAPFKNERRPTVPSAFVLGRSAWADR